MAWDPKQYLKFGGERLRPVYDLVARVPLEAPRGIADLGCGTGAMTAILKAHWPEASIVAIDNSQAMLDRARAAVSGIAWQLSDIAKWKSEALLDLLASNAALHWVDDHATLFPRLLSMLKSGGVLAVQMPAQHNAPSHRVGYELAGSERWRDRLNGLVRRRPILEYDDYYAIVRPHASSVDIWFTEYVHVLSGENPVAEFTKGSFVGVWLSALSESEAHEFEVEYRTAIAAAYPKQADGVTLFPFRRFFLVAQR